MGIGNNNNKKFSKNFKQKQKKKNFKK